MPPRTVFMDITDAGPARLRAAVEFLFEGRAVSCDGVCFAAADGVLYVSVVSPFSPQHLTDAVARREIERANEVYHLLAEASPEFRLQASFLRRRYSVIHDAGTVAVELCYLDGDNLVWRRERKDGEPAAR